MNATLDLLKAHRSIRKFKTDPVDDPLFEQIISAAQCTATSSFVQACTVIRVRNPETRAQLATIAGGQAYVESAPLFSVFCADLRRAQHCCEINGETMNDGFTEQFLIATVDVALFAQSAVIAAESLGLGICYIGAMRNNPAAVSKLLQLPAQVYPVFGLCLGYPDQDPECKPRLPVSEILKEETFSDDSKDALSDYDQQMRDYYASRSSNQKVQGWTEQMAGMMTKESRPHMRGFLESQGLMKK